MTNIRFSKHIAVCILFFKSNKGIASNTFNETKYSTSYRSKIMINKKKFKVCISGIFYARLLLMYTQKPSLGISFLEQILSNQNSSYYVLQKRIPLNAAV